jgi:hypothetical protein
VPSLRSFRTSVSPRRPRTRLRAELQVVWSETGSTLKRVWIVLWTSAVILLALGVWGDNTGFWTDKPYLTNTFSALTSAAFGVPVALIVLQRVSASEADAAEARSARRMAGRVSADLALTVSALVRDGIPAMTAAQASLRDQRDSLVPNGDYWRSSTAPRLHYRPYIDAIESAIRVVERLFISNTKQHLAEVSAQWSILTTESRFRLLSTSNQWLPGQQVEEIGALIFTVTGPILEDWRRRGQELQEWYHREDQQPQSLSFGEMDTLRAFSSWLNAIMNYIDAVIDLTKKSSLLARTLESP